MILERCFFFIAPLCTRFVHINNGTCFDASGKPSERIYSHLTHFISPPSFVAKQVWRRHRHDYLFTTSCLNIKWRKVQMDIFKIPKSSFLSRARALRSRCEGRTKRPVFHKPSAAIAPSCSRASITTAAQRVQWFMLL